MFNAHRQNLLRVDKTANLIGMISLMLFVSSISFLASDMVVPSLPHIAKDLHTTAGMVQLSITSYILGFSFPQLIFGPLSDRFGRRIIMLYGSLIFMIGSVICCLTHNIHMIILARLIQGIGTSALMALTRSMMSDLFEGKKFSRVASYTSMVVVLIPGIGPVLGSYIHHAFGWRAVFIYLALHGAMTVLAIVALMPETNRQLDPKALQPRVMLQNYWLLLTNKSFMGYVLCSGISFAGLIVYYTMSTFLFQNVLGLSVIQYGCLALPMTIAMFLGRFVNSFLLSHYHPDTIIQAGNMGLLTAALMMLITGLCGLLNVTIVIIPMMLFIFFTGLILTNAMAAAFTPFRHIGGVTGALYGTIQMLITFIATAIAASVHQHNQITLAAILTGLSLAGTVGFAVANSLPQKRDQAIPDPI